MKRRIEIRKGERWNIIARRLTIQKWPTERRTVANKRFSRYICINECPVIARTADGAATIPLMCHRRLAIMIQLVEYKEGAMRRPG